jgi:hypothetical protein
VTNFDIEYVKARLRQAVAAADQPHYGYNDTELDHLHDGIAIVRGLIEELENQHATQTPDR